VPRARRAASTSTWWPLECDHTPRGVRSPRRGERAAPRRRPTPYDDEPVLPPRTESERLGRQVRRYRCGRRPSALRPVSTSLHSAGGESHPAASGRSESDDFGISETDLSGHHSNPPGPLEALLNDTVCDAGTNRKASNDGRTRAPRAPGQAVGAAHPRQGRIISAIAQVLGDTGDPIHARDVHARVEMLLGEPVRWASVKATLAGNIQGPAARFVRVARGQYRLPDLAPTTYHWR